MLLNDLLRLLSQKLDLAKAVATMKRTGHILQIHTDQGITGEFVGGSDSDYAQMGMFTHYLIGKNPLQRELIYNDVKRALRKQDRLSMGPVDITLWDIAGKLYNAPVWELLGGYRRTVPAYASTYHGDENGGLDSPQAFADFAVQCKLCPPRTGLLKLHIKLPQCGSVQRSFLL